MGQLRSLQEELRKLLFIGSSETTSRFWDGELPKRLQVYRNTVHGNCYDTLDADFSLTKKQFSEEDWIDLSRAFFTKHPPSYWELNHCVLAFPKFLAAGRTKPAIVELSEYELTDLLVFVNTSVVRGNLGITNPTVETRVFQHEILEWVENECEPEKMPAQKPEVLVFYRDADLNCHVKIADPLMLLMLDHYKFAGAQLDDLEPIRRKILPQNTVSLKTVLDNLVQMDLILL